jgi:hypothetical protein
MYPLEDERIKYVIYKMSYLTIKKLEWNHIICENLMEVVDIILSETSQTHKDKYACSHSSVEFMLKKRVE